MRQVRQVVPAQSPVLLTGETGVGKDAIANAIHLNSPRRDGPFIPENCGAIPDALLDSELFGHGKGAFTGALSQKRGRFERADRGTIPLDEIGEMPLEAQVRLLRVLQHREIERLILNSDALRYRMKKLDIPFRKDGKKQIIVCGVGPGFPVGIQTIAFRKISF